MTLLTEGFPNHTASVGSFRLDELRLPSPVRSGDIVSVTAEVPGTHAPESREDRGDVHVELRAENGDGEEVPSRDSTNVILTRAGSETWPLEG